MKKASLDTTTKVLLWLLVINLGIAVGAGLYEHRIVVPEWTEGGWNADAAREANTGLRFWVYVTTVPLTLLTLASLVVVWWTSGDVRKWWLIALAAVLIDRFMTFGYFIPTMVKLTSGTVPDAAAVVLQWTKLNYVRHIASMSAFILMLKTFSVFYRRK